jgi:prepilin-type N-terminal cleavage/methylation domain-containing protein
MKLPKQVTGGRRQVAGTGCGGNLVTRHPSLVTGFTMVEIAISLAIIGIALVGIIGVLPLGLNARSATAARTPSSTRMRPSSPRPSARARAARMI